jgi:uncharacterized protein
MQTVRRALTLVCVLLMVGLSVAQDTVGPAPSREEVLKFMDLLRIRPQLTQYFQGVAKQAKLGAEEGFKQKIPDATPAQLAQVDKFAENLFKDMPINEMIDAMIPIYQKHLTKEDLGAILAFYSSPVGQKLQREQPAMMQEGMQVGGEIGRRRLSTMMQQMDDFIVKLAEQQPKPSKQ